MWVTSSNSIGVFLESHYNVIIRYYVTLNYLCDNIFTIKYKLIVINRDKIKGRGYCLRQFLVPNTNVQYLLGHKIIPVTYKQSMLVGKLRILSLPRSSILIKIIKFIIICEFVSYIIIGLLLSIPLAPTHLGNLMRLMIGLVKVMDM